MHLYKNFFRLLRHNLVGVIIYAVIFVAMILGLSMSAEAMGPSDIEYKKSYKISYSDSDDSVLSRGLIEYLSKENEVTDLSGRSEESVLDMVFFSVSEYHMDIEAGFEEAVENGEDAKITYTTNSDLGGVTFAADTMVNNYISSYCDYRKMGYSKEEAASKADELLEVQTRAFILTADEDHVMTGKDSMIYTLYNFFGYLIIGFMALGIGHIIVANNNKKIGDRISSSPVNGKKISISNTMGLITSGVAAWALFSGIAWVLGHDTVIYRDYWWLFVINSLVATLVACSLTSLITSFDIEHNTLNMVTNIISLGMSFICGVFVPLDVLSDGLLNIARFFPLYWMVCANEMTKAGGFINSDRLLLYIGIELLFAVALAVLAAMIKMTRLSRIKHA
ncbi:MAG: ABC transporter permease [Saccharofermentans sp.]|nr:ABC transporter permease [Saccharofermentans sp.]